MVKMGRRVVSVVGATGLVGSEIARILFLRKFPLRRLNLFSSGRSPETEATVLGNKLPIRPFSMSGVRGSDITFLAAGGQFSRTHARAIAHAGSVVIDNSSAFRMLHDVPLVVPEVNAHDVFAHKGIIANPNCSTIQLVVVLAPLHRRYNLRRVVVSTYQSVSGAGLRAVGELAAHSEAILAGESPEPREFPREIGFNIIPHIDRFDSLGWTFEETKMINETRKILGDDSIRVIATAARVPVFRGHSESVFAEFEEPVDLKEARDLLERAEGVRVVDEPSRARYPTPLDCAGRDETFVGRIRLDPTSPRGLCMWIVSDNLRKGAALNAVQIAEHLIRATDPSVRSERAV
jgi:aspartate-semialdehyde dehydrogenase